jgi:hypothetical protein
LVWYDDNEEQNVAKKCNRRKEETSKLAWQKLMIP